MASKAPRKPVFKYFLKATHGIVSQITRGPDGRMWVTEDFADKLGAITDAGVVKHYSTGGKGRRPNTIVVGPDRKLWYTLYSSKGKVGRMTTGGVRAEASTGAVPESLVGIGLGAANSLWVGGEFSQLWELNTDGGTVLHLQPPDLAASRIPSGFVAGSDGRTWVNLGLYLAAIDQSGTITEYTAGYRPNPKIRNLVLGPDGNVWFTDSQELTRVGAIGRITPTGEVTYFQKGLKRGSAPLGITVGPDRNLWFTENRGGPHIGRITKKGVITLYKIPLPASYTATAIARGKGRHLWVASNGLQGLVRVTVP